MRVNVKVAVIVFAVGMIPVALPWRISFSLHPGTWIEAGMWSGSFSLVRIDDKGFPSFASFMKTVDDGRRRLIRASRYLPDANWLKRAVPTGVGVSGFRVSLLAIPIVAAGYLAILAALTLLRFARCLMMNPLTVEELRQRRGVCVVCEYDLTGNVSGVCPECGTAIAGGPSRDPQAAQDATGPLRSAPLSIAPDHLR
ncbi:MAG: hypothetical protein BroJett003_15200 [Planctomycetota bacterium]|nr:MAG: hypothetical protein BroJett003_15200 [Planctomycetota bacterium]